MGNARDAHKPEGPSPVGKPTAAAGLPPWERGLVMVFTGNGKGKTTAAFGQALRALGHGKKVCIIQFMKKRDYGEFLAAEKYLPDLALHRFGLDSFVMRDHPAPVDVALAREGLAKAREVVSSGAWDLVILDEINVAVDFQLLSLEEVLSLVRERPPRVHLLLTGRYAPQALLEAADLVSEVREIRHHYAAGVKEQAGIEY